MEKERPTAPTPSPIPRLIIKHNLIGNRAPHHDQNTLVECTPFSTMGKIQPFMVSMATNAVLVMDFHCHLTTSEVVGYLAGHWDVNAHNLAITHAFPCRTRLGDRELAPLVEADIYRGMEQRHLTLVGWYHSHPNTTATPTLRDIDSQLDYQIRMKGTSDASYTPCVGVICSPYNLENQSLESSVVSYWVMPPAESKPHEYGKPMLMSYSVVQDQFLSQDSLNEMKRCVDFYKNERDFIKFSDKYKVNITYLEKLKMTVTSKFPRDQSDGILWSFIQELVCPGSGSSTSHLLSPPELPTTLNTTLSPLDRVNLLVPNIPMPPLLNPNNNNLANNLMMGSDIANALFASGKFPSPSSLMGLASDHTRSALGSANLALNNMFLSPVGFKLDNISILKPLSNNSNPIPSTSKAAISLVPDNSSIMIQQTEPSSFTTSDILDKNCTITSGQAI